MYVESCHALTCHSDPALFLINGDRGEETLSAFSDWHFAGQQVCADAIALQSACSRESYQCSCVNSLSQVPLIAVVHSDVFCGSVLDLHPFCAHLLETTVELLLTDFPNKRT